MPWWWRSYMDVSLCIVYCLARLSCRRTLSNPAAAAAAACHVINFEWTQYQFISWNYVIIIVAYNNAMDDGRSNPAAPGGFPVRPAVRPIHSNPKTIMWVCLSSINHHHHHHHSSRLLDVRRIATKFNRSCSPSTEETRKGRTRSWFAGND